MMRRWLLAVFLIKAALAGPAQAAAPQEVRFASLDGTDIKAWLFLPDSRPDPLPDSQPRPQPDAAQRPLVVALHGCGGLYANAGPRKGQFIARHRAMADLLVAQGYAVLFPDSFTPRGVDSICAVRGRNRTVTQAERRRDVLAALAWARSQPWADPARVAVLGWSHGGSAVLSATDANHAEVKAQVPFKTAIAFYPGCADAQKARYRPNTPLTLLLAADDDWTPSDTCVDLAKHLQSANITDGKDAPAVQTVVYPGAVHGFDDPAGPVRERSDVPSRLHPGHGVMQGPNPAAREDSRAQVQKILAQAFLVPR